MLLLSSACFFFQVNFLKKSGTLYQCLDVESGVVNLCNVKSHLNTSNNWAFADKERRPPCVNLFSCTSKPPEEDVRWCSGTDQELKGVNQNKSIQKKWVK